MKGLSDRIIGKLVDWCGNNPGYSFGIVGCFNAFVMVYTFLEGGFIWVINAFVVIVCIWFAWKLQNKLEYNLSKKVKKDDADKSGNDVYEQNEGGTS